MTLEGSLEIDGFMNMHEMMYEVRKLCSRAMYLEVVANEKPACSSLKADGGGFGVA